MKATLFLLLTIALLLVGLISLSSLMSSSKKDDGKKGAKLYSKTEVYKSIDQLTDTDIKLNYKDSTFSYQEKYILKPGDDVGYEAESTGRFKMDKDTLILYSDMPDNSHLEFDTHRLTPEEISKNKFSYIYPIDEPAKDHQVKIYFDNIADIEDYKAFTIINNQLKPLKILERRKMDQEKLIKTKNDNFFLFHYLIIEKPANNQLLITGARSESFRFDFNKIPYSTFHFFTRVYWNFSDFTGFKFYKTEKAMKRIISQNDKRREYSQALNSDFIKQ